MNASDTLASLSPSITKMIRMDHTHVMLLWHRFDPWARPSTKRSIVRAVCLGLEIHAQLEEEIFYPALREVAPDEPAVRKAQPEHEEMKRLIADLRERDMTRGADDQLLGSLMRDVIHHVADEETVLLPLAEQRLGDRLGELGGRMTKRRLQLVGPRTGELLASHVGAMPVGSMLMGVALLAGGIWMGRGLGQGTGARDRLP